MTNAAAVPFHTGPELSRAINRTDFFRLFKAAAQHYRFDNFALARISEANAPFGEREIVITNIAERRAPLFIQMLKEALGPVKAKTAQFLTTPVYGKSGSIEADLVFNEFNRNTFLLIPLFTPEGRRYCLVLSGTRPEPDQGEVADVLLDAMRIFDKLYEEILTQEMSGRLTQREAEIVKWTSEGKTSAEIAIILGLSEHTVNSHITAAVRKLNAVNRVHMVAIALRNGLVS
ncbi:helix-turn-helix transcriptional regulator [Rhizobium sullae]|uniref:DNA-binding CsgD family transcriptional regulator n=1 Tax=Rhizobium sullae TaxID=50338 RepID=A0A2N0D448_RHISU|nr:LuxR C-terminal-related transcriptional regulator [Rhizobium sullae]PKA40838.1 helix-turn-helix transcriptional regulator [Rhizobium sullae]TCU18823.1 DNA-binding CsgD family transcriptional regulator [Rhizobium sullae]UWU14680.1 LuxR C-terminal-related transcriptional regulator [Rhizobium sullae]